MDKCLVDWKKKAVLTASVKETVTSRMIRTVYTEMKNNIALDIHASLVSLQKMNGIDMGIHHYERTSATRMVTVIADEMRKTLVTYIKQTNFPISVLVDTTTDPSVVNYLSIFLRTMENGLPRCYFYRLVRVNSEKAQDLKELMLETFKKDDIWEEMKSRLIGFASDGASVMTGSSGGLGRLLSNEIGRNLYMIHCSPHKLQLAVGHAFDSDETHFIRNVLEKTVNSIYSFYNRNAVKRKSSLRQTAEALDETLYELNYIFKVRWVSSEYSALDRVNKSYITILSNLEGIQVSADFRNDAETKEIAKNLYNTMLNTRFYSILLFTMDLLHNLKDESTRLQQKESIIIGMEHYRKGLIKSLQNLKTSNGPALALFLHNSKCIKNGGELKKCTTADLDTKEFHLKSANALFKLKKTETARHHRHSHDSPPPLSEIRGKIIDGLVSEINRYFPAESMEVFDVLEPSKLPATADEVFVFAPKIFGLAKLMQIDEQKCSNEYSILLRSLIIDHSSEFCAHKEQNKPIEFWSHFLESKTVVWNDNIKQLVMKVLALPISTADVERSFSILTNTRYDRRSRLTVENLENIMFLRLNGPPPEAFNAIRYAKVWLDKGGMKTDDPRKHRVPPKNELPPSNLFY